MSVPSVNINFVAVLVGAAVQMAIGMLWYSPILFGNLWMRLMGFTDKDVTKAKKKEMIKSYIIMFISILVMTFLVAFFVSKIGVVDFVDGGIVGFQIWIGFIATTMLGSVLWEGKSWKLYLINTGHYLVVLIVSGAILGHWR